MTRKQISFNTSINPTLQIGDIAWVATLDLATNITGDPQMLGVVDSILPTSITVEIDSSNNVVVNTDMFLMFSKPIEVNESSIKGYYADVTLENASKKYAELFAISSEIALSSK